MMISRKRIRYIIVLLALTLSIAGCKQVSNFAVENIDVYTFVDGESVSTGHYKNDNKLIYRLDDGTEILAEEQSVLLEDTRIFQETQTDVREKITAYYERQGSLYNVEEYLLKAYKEYLSNETKFKCYLLSQETTFAASNETIIYCTTRIFLPLGEGGYDEYFFTQAFDKKSGDALDNVELFSVDSDTVKNVFLSQYTEDNDILKVLSEDFRLEYVCFFPDGYEIVFPHETATKLDMDGNIRFGGPFTDEILSIVNLWAVPT